MLETPQERIKLLRAGFTGKAIEELYIEGNNFKLERFPVIVELAEFVISRDNKSIIHEIKAEFNGES
jgi:hypothetical protein